jgi:UDP-N-acetylglucosamine 2-epimerase (non-hydrolysing)
VDDPHNLAAILASLNEIAQTGPGGHLQVLFPVHPRTRQRIADFGLETSASVLLLEPLGYLDFLALQSQASLVLTDSGGIQEETTHLGVPCLTVRPNTERPVTVTLGTNQLVENSAQALLAAMRARLCDRQFHDTQPPLWDGKAAERIVQVIRQMG